ncbi:MAG: DNA-protecting protein DprA, partial [Acidobacteriota bacterium]|nr:DNA-protecting protein DprA [Acidobacteriota bacterium]
GVTVVSGLADGIAGAVLRGALDAADHATGSARRAAAVLGTGHDAAAGAEQEQLRRRLAGSGLVLSELPPGAPSARWRFASRHRIVAALVDLIVVVEAHDGDMRGAVTAARRRRVPVAAVPGSVRSGASAGTNALLVHGAACVRDGPDVLALLSGHTGWTPAPPPGGGRRRSSGEAPAVPPPGELGAAVLAAVSAAPADIDAIARWTGAPVGNVALSLEQLAAAGLARAEGGWWRAAPARR